MKTKNISLKAWIPNATPKQGFDVWTSSTKHAELIGASASIKPEEGAKFKMWDGSIFGTNVKLEPEKLIQQKWAADDWPEGHFSDLSIKLHAVGKMKGTALQLTQKNIPADKAKDIEQGWKDYYFEPLKTFFNA